MNIDKLKERSSQNIIIKDIRNKEVYPGDIIVISKSNCSLIPVMILKLNPKSIKCITLKETEFNYFGDFIKITSFYDKEEIDQWNLIKDKYFSTKEKEKAERIKEGLIMFFFKDIKINKCGICYSKVVSDPGKNINLKNIKNAISWTKEQSDKEFYVFTKNMLFEKDVKESEIFVGLDNTFHNYYISLYRPLLEANKFYYASKSTFKTLEEVKSAQNIEKKNSLEFERYYIYNRYSSFNKDLFKYILTSDIEITTDTIKYLPVFRFIENRWGSLDKTKYFGEALFQKFEEYF